MRRHTARWAAARSPAGSGGVLLVDRPGADRLTLEDVLGDRCRGAQTGSGGRTST
jgi:hypothetical protein